MNIHEAASSGKPFLHPDMIGAWMIVDGQLVHRDNITDFKDMQWIRMNCLWPQDYVHRNDLYWMTTNELLRTDWSVVIL